MLIFNFFLLVQYLGCTSRYHPGDPMLNPRNPDYASYCFAFGPDGCLGLTFNCKLFTSMVSTDHDLTFYLRGNDFTSYVGLGFSQTNEISRSARMVSLFVLLVKYLYTYKLMFFIIIHKIFGDSTGSTAVHGSMFSWK